MNILEKLFVPITKIDQENRLVYGILAAEVPDRVDEILDYESSKKAFEEWRDNAVKSSGGKSKGNLRVMHTEKVAGLFTDIQLDDENKQVLAVAKVIDDAEWKMVEEGAYTGFSVGARVAKRQKDPANPKLTRWTIGKMVEGSLVDLPCIPDCTFDVMKGDLKVETRKFKVNPLKAAESPYLSTVTPNFKADFKTAQAALAKVGSADRTLAAFKVVAQSAGIKKSLWDASDLACALMAVNNIRLNLTAEAMWEGDDSPIPEKLRTWVDEGASILQSLVSEEAEELTADAPANADFVTYADNKVDVTKSDVQKTEVSMADETKTEKTETVETPEIKIEEITVKAEQADVTKSIAAALDPITKKFDEAVSALNEKAQATDKNVNELIDSVKTILEVLKKTPVPSKALSPAAVAIAKEQDSTTKTVKQSDARSAFKDALDPANAKSLTISPLGPAK